MNSELCVSICDCVCHPLAGAGCQWFLLDTIEDLQDLLHNGLHIEGRQLNVCIKCIVCDAPARAMVKGTKLCSGYFGCEKCVQKGAWFGRVTYPETSSALRTDQSFRAFLQADHHTGPTPLTQLDIDMVNTFSIDYMHQVCLGVMKRLILLWKRGPKQVRISQAQCEEISTTLRALRPFVPVDFARKPRGLNEVDHWKATEYRQFLLYTGQFGLKGVLPDEYYEYFMSLSIALCILVSSKYAHTLNNFAHRLLVWFVRKGRQLYGNEFLVYNVHSLTHLAREAEFHGNLDSCAAWRFESYLHQLKKLVRSGKNPVGQIVKRLTERKSQRITTESALKRSNLTERPNNAYTLDSGECCEVIGFQGEAEVEQNTHLLCRIYRRSEALFMKPCDSRLVGFVKVHHNHSQMKELLFSRLKAKCMMIDQGDWKIFLPLLHETA